MYNVPVRVAGLLVIVFLLSYTATARANGRFPEAQQIATVPGDPSTVYLRTTFGMLVSRDSGKSWRWLCERALGYEGQWDPSIALTKDGRLFVGLETGIASTKDGCTVERAPELEGQSVKDLTTDSKGESVWAITGAPGKMGYVWRYTLASAKWERLAALADVNMMTIEVAPSNSNRLYVSGQPYKTIRGQIYRSDDGGKTFTSDIGDGGAASSGLEATGPFFIGAIDHDDPNRILVRHLHAKGSDLLLTKDGGKTFKNVLAMKSSMFGFAKSDDGKNYWAGSGLPEHGIFRSTDRGETWSNVNHHGVLCLFSAPGTLFVCENTFTYGAYTIALSNDDGATINPIAKFTDVGGAVDCPGTDGGGGMCAAAWPEMRSLLVAPADAGPELEEPIADAGRKKKRRRDAGTSEQPDTTASKHSTCGCEAAGAANGATDRAWLIGALALVVGAVTRCRRASRLDHSPLSRRRSS